MVKADLHIHSEHSLDGEIPVAGIVDRCVEAGVDIFTISDHNTVAGVEEAVAMAAERGLGFIPAIEIDCNFRGDDMHLLGYGINWRSKDFEELDRDISRKTVESFSEILHSLARLGIEVDAADVARLAGGKLPSGELIAETLLTMDKYDYPQLAPYRPGGERSDMPYLNFYFDFLAQGRPAYVKVEFMDYAEAVELVRDNGGTPVVAHAGLNFKGREETAEKLLAAGARGLEVFNNYHDARQSEYFAGLAVAAGALITCGSDFHGKTKPTISVGQYNFTDKYGDWLSDSIMRLCSK